MLFYNMNKLQKIAILDASSGSVVIKYLDDSLQREGVQIEEVEEYYDLDSNSDFIYGDIDVTVEL